MWKKFSFLGCVLLLLAACSSSSSHLSQLEVPNQVTHQNQSYKLVAQSDLGTMARYFYLREPDNIQKWQSAVEILFDRNVEGRSLSQRLAFRKSVYQRIKVAAFDLYEQAGFLYAFVIYAPNSEHNSWQVDVAKGKDILNCGFVQYQYSLQLESNRQIQQMTDSKLISYLKKYIVQNELEYLKQSPWHWNCSGK